MTRTTVLAIGIWMLLTFVPLSCFADDGVKNLPTVAERRARTAIMVHRGSLDLAVENTLAAIEASFLTEADGVEIDIAQTSDGILVLMHDSWVDRVLNGFGNVAELTHNELLAMQYRDPYGLTRANEHVPTLRETFELIDRFNGLIHLDIKTPGIDGRVHDMLVDMDLLRNVVTVNAYNSKTVRADSRIKVLPSQGSLIHGNNDYDAKAVRERLARRPKGTLLVDDARCAAAVLGRRGAQPIDAIVLKSPLVKRSRERDAALAKLDPTELISRLGQFAAVRQFEVDKTRSQQAAKVINRRAEIARALGRATRADATVFQALETMIKDRSLHADGAWQGVDGSQAAIALAAIRPDAQTVDRLNHAVQDVDSRLKFIEQREELPTWLRQSGAWWDFRIKTESIAALGRMSNVAARDALWTMLRQSPAEAEPKWRELHWDAAKALTAGAWQLTPDELEQLLIHETSGVRRAGCVYLAHYHDRDAYQALLREYLPWWTN